MNSHWVIGTAGHVDHGKTAFIRHLTGIETDRLRDEQSRGITIENGYAHLKLPNESVVGFIDVPGHERFIKTMLAGAMSIDAVLLIVAADEGIKPQTIEHFHILNHLNVNRGLIVITKKDLVPESRLTQLEHEIRDMVFDSNFSEMPIHHYSIFDDTCREEMILALEELSQFELENKAYAASRLNVDRVFSVKGFGTVVTGTLIEGTIEKGDSLYLYPGEKKCRVKGLQVYGRSVDVAEYGQRTAINLSIDLDEIVKGDTLTSIENFEPTMMIDVLFATDLLDQDIKHWQRLKLYHGTREVLCRIVLGTDMTLSSNVSKKVQLRLESPIYCKANDPFILRSYSPMKTLGGGVVVSPYASKRVIQESEDEAGEQYASTELLQALRQMPHIFTLDDKLFSKTSLDLVEGYAVFNKLTEQGELIQLIDDKYMLLKDWQVISDIIIDETLKEHKQFPLRPGIMRETLKSKLLSRFNGISLTKHEFAAIIKRLILEETLIERAGALALKAHNVVLSGTENAIVAQVEALMKTHHQAIVPFDELLKLNFNKNLVKEVLYHLINHEILVKINDEGVMHTELYQTSKGQLLDYFQSHSEIGVADFRDLTGFSRKVAVMLLEHFDRIQLTKRNENTRTLIKR